MVLQPTYNYVEDHFYEINFLYLKKKNQLKMYYTVFVLITSERPNKFSISKKSQFWIHFIDIVPHS